jgi:hypothetical protein
MAYINQEMMTVYEAEDLGIGMGQWDFLKKLAGGAKDIFAEYYKHVGKVETQAEMEKKLAEARGAGATPQQLAMLQQAMMQQMGMGKKSFMDKYGIYLILGGAAIVVVLLLMKKKS